MRSHSVPHSLSICELGRLVALETRPRTTSVALMTGGAGRGSEPLQRAAGAAARGREPLQRAAGAPPRGREAERPALPVGGRAGGGSSR